MTKKTDIINHERSTEGLKLFSSNIEPMIKKLLGKSGFTSVDILKNWTHIVGEDLAAHTLPERLDFKKNSHDNGTLYLIVSSGALALEVQHKIPKIIEKINTYFGYHAVEHIKIIQNKSYIFEKTDINIADIKKKKLVTPDKQNYIDEITSGIEDEELKNHLEMLACAILSEQKKEN